MPRPAPDYTELNFEFIKDNYAKPAFKKFILQPAVPLPENEEEVCLSIEAQDINGSLLERTALPLNPGSLAARGELAVGNIAFTKKQVKYFIDADAGSTEKISSLVFEPYNYEDYIAYTVKANPAISDDLQAHDLKPSPPAPPADDEN